MKVIVACMLSAGLALTALAPAEAAGGCGRGGHRGPAGHCRPNYRTPVVGRYYHNQGYWDGHRYWRNRYRHNGGWRYR